MSYLLTLLLGLTAYGTTRANTTLSLSIELQTAQQLTFEMDDSVLRVAAITTGYGGHTEQHTYLLEGAGTPMVALLDHIDVSGPSTLAILEIPPRDTAIARH